MRNLSNWEHLWISLRDRLIAPWREPTFTVYFLFAVVLLGGMGIWIPVIQCAYATASTPELHLAVTSGIATYLIAIVASAISDMVLGNERPSLRITVLSASGVAIILGTLAIVTGSPTTAYELSIPAALVSLAIWCVMNGNADRFQEPPATAATGGDPQKQLPGTLKDFKV